MNWLCKIGIHKKISERTAVYGNGFMNSDNIKEYCSRCGKVFDHYGVTHVGPINISVKAGD